MKTSVETITPILAQKYLDLNTNNRKLREGHAERMAHDMQSGHWTQCTAPVVFYDDGSVADGQHRLWAIVESNKTQTFVVIRGLSREDGLNIDTGKPRDLVDNGRISGVADYLSHTLIAVARAIEEGSYSDHGLSYAERLALVQKHREAAMFVIAHGPKGKYLRNAMVLAAMARAYMSGVNRETLQRFGDVLTSGMSEGARESAAVAMRNYLQSRGGLNGRPAAWYDTFQKVQNAIKHFVAGKQLTLIKAVSEEAYPLELSKQAKAQRTAASPKTQAKREARV